MTSILISPRRRDGKFPVCLTFPGAPNAFGGFYPSRSFNKLYTAAQVFDAVQKHGDDEQRAFYTAQRLGLAGPSRAAAAEAGPTLHLTAEEANALREHLANTLDSLSNLDCDEENDKRILGLLEGIRSRLT